MTLSEIEERLRLHSDPSGELAVSRRAAVSLILHQAADEVEFLLIHRSERHGDPWSGQMALPGGRQQPEDRDLLQTAVRETREEVGLDLDRLGRKVATLDQIQAAGRGAAIDLAVTPFVHVLSAAPPPLANDPAEVQGALWVPLTVLSQPHAQTTFHYQIGGRSFDHPAFVHRGYTVWGLTYRILTQFLDRIGSGSV